MKEQHWKNNIKSHDINTGCRYALSYIYLYCMQMLQNFICSSIRKLESSCIARPCSHTSHCKPRTARDPKETSKGTWPSSHCCWWWCSKGKKTKKPKSMASPCLMRRPRRIWWSAFEQYQVQSSYYLYWVIHKATVNEIHVSGHPPTHNFNGRINWSLLVTYVIIGHVI